MILSWHWLKQFVDLGALNPDQLSELLNARGLEVESYNVPEQGVLDCSGEIYPNIIAAKVIKSDKMSDKSGKCLTLVDVGGKEVSDPTSCELFTGQMVAYCNDNVNRTVGDKQYWGQICCYEDLGICSDKEQSPVKLPSCVKPGQPVGELLLSQHPETTAPFHCATFEIGLTPDRGDCLSQLGLAREVAAALKLEKKELKYADLDASLQTIDKVQLDPECKCVRYLAIELSNVSVLPSPLWLKSAVESCGARSINTLVDITNFICFELGHPMHAFDLEQVSSNQVRVRMAKDGEVFKAISHNKYELNETDVVIDLGGEVHALAGVMGGEKSEVSLDTNRVLLEIASFNPSLVRKTAKRLALHSESSHRFERFVDPNGVIRAALRALYLIQACQEKPVQVIAYQDVYPHRLIGREISLSVELVNRRMGVELTAEKISDLLRRIDIPNQIQGDSILVSVPTFRSDITRPIDLIEEIARGYGIDNIQAKLPVVELNFIHKVRENIINKLPYPLDLSLQSRLVRNNRQKLRTTLIDSGLLECMHYTFAERDEVERLGYQVDDRLNNMMAIANPLSAEMGYMRTMLLPSMLRALKRNQSRQEDSFAAFELGTVFQPTSHGQHTILSEQERLCILMSGQPNKTWDCMPETYDVFDLKGILEFLSDRMKLDLTFKYTDKVPFLYPNVQIGLFYRESCIGHLGELHPHAVQGYKLTGRPIVAEIAVAPILGHVEQLRGIVPPICPKSVRDMAMLLPVTATFEQISKVISDQNISILESWSLFDIYKGSQVAHDMQSVALRFNYRDPNGDTLKEEDITGAHAQILSALQSNLSAVLR